MLEVFFLFLSAIIVSFCVYFVIRLFSKLAGKKAVFFSAVSFEKRKDLKVFDRKSSLLLAPVGLQMILLAQVSFQGIDYRLALLPLFFFLLTPLLCQMILRDGK